MPVRHTVAGMIGGDPTHLDDLARQLRALGAEVAQAAERIATGEGVAWASTAAESFRDRLRSHGRWVLSCRDEVLDAAAAFAALADALRQRQTAIAAAEHAVLGLLAHARDTIESLVGISHEELSEADRHRLATAHEVVDRVGRPPLRGSPEWLDVAASVHVRGHHG